MQLEATTNKMIWLDYLVAGFVKTNFKIVGKGKKVNFLDNLK